MLPPDNNDDDDAPPPRAWPIIALLGGALLIAAFFGLGETVQGLRISFLGEADRSSTGEVYFWLGAALLLLPGAGLCGLGLGLLCSPAALGRLLARLDQALAALGPRRAGGLAFGLAFAVAALGQRLILRGYPITDEEAVHLQSGLLLLRGHLTMTLPLPLDAFPNRFLWLRGAEAASMDWPGISVAWALAVGSGLGSLLFAACAALPALALVRLLWRRLSPRAAAAGLLLWLFSPMAFALSVTTHSHVLSRGLLALALWAYDAAQAPATTAKRRAAGLAGLLLGLAFTCRAAEIAALALPFVVHELWLALRGDGAARARLRWLSLGAALPLLLFFLQPLLIHHSPLPLRLAPENGVDSYAVGTLWHRFGLGLSYNLLLLLVWSIGPLGLLALPLWGAGARDAFTRLLLCGVLVDLLLTLLHDVGGIHVVGPIHYSECAVPLVLLAVEGLWRLARGASALGGRWLRGPLVLAAVGVVTLGLGGFNTVHALALRRQADLQAAIYQALEAQVAAQGGAPALVLAPPFHKVWAQHPLGRAGTKVFDWRRPRPDLSDPVLIAQEVPGWERLRQQLPGRRVLRLRSTPQPPYLQLDPVP